MRVSLGIAVLHSSSSPPPPTSLATHPAWEHPQRYIPSFWEKPRQAVESRGDQTLPSRSLLQRVGNVRLSTCCWRVCPISIIGRYQWGGAMGGNQFQRHLEDHPFPPLLCSVVKLRLCPPRTTFPRVPGKSWLLETKDLPSIPHCKIPSPASHLETTNPRVPRSSAQCF